MLNPEQIIKWSKKTYPTRKELYDAIWTGASERERKSIHQLRNTKGSNKASDRTDIPWDDANSSTGNTCHLEKCGMVIQSNDYIRLQRKGIHKGKVRHQDCQNPELSTVNSDFNLGVVEHHLESEFSHKDESSVLRTHYLILAQHVGEGSDYPTYQKIMRENKWDDENEHYDRSHRIYPELVLASWENAERAKGGKDGGEGDGTPKDEKGKGGKPIPTSTPDAPKGDGGEGDGPTPKPEPKDEPRGNNHEDNLMDALIDKVVKKVQEKLGDLSDLKEATNHAKREISREARKIIKDALGGVEREPRKIRVDVKGEVAKINMPHEKLPELINKAVELKKHCYLWGPPASGKSTACKTVAEILKLDFNFMTVGQYTSKHDLEGFKTPSNEYADTPLAMSFRNGSVFMMDEMDNATGNCLVTLNTMLANDSYAFPDPKHLEPQQAHEDFIFLGCGNTCGSGSSPQFPNRHRFDSSFADRFCFIYWGYDKKCEQAITLHKAKHFGVDDDIALEFLQYVWKVREYCETSHPEILVSPRTSFVGVEFLSLRDMTQEQAMIDLVFKTTDEATARDIIEAVKDGA